MQTAFIDLHLHLDGSLYLPWAYNQAIKEGVVPSDTTFEQYYDMMNLDNCQTREEIFKKFEFPCLVMQTKEGLKGSIYSLISLLAKQGLIYAEIRYAPCQHCEKGLTQQQVIESLLEGINQATIDFPTIKVGLLNCLMHKGPNAAFNMDTNMETVLLTKQYLGKGVVGLDLAGFENNGDFKDYAPLFVKAKELGIPYTIHAGEQGDGSHVIDAINMGANRIGHGIDCMQNPQWLQTVVDTQIPLEINLTSNVNFTRNYASHPIRKLLEAGVKVTFNTDNMTFSKTNLANEHNQLLALGISQETLIKAQYTAVDVCFGDEATKQQLRNKLDSYFNK